MTNRQNQSLNHLLSYHLAKVDHYKSLKMASANNPALFHHYAEQQYLNQALAHKYEASIAEAIHQKVINSKQIQYLLYFVMADIIYMRGTGKQQ